MKLTYEEILNDPSLLERIEQQARRERAKAVRELIVLPIKQLFGGDHVRPYRPQGEGPQGCGAVL